MLTFGAHLGGNVMTSVLLQKSFSCHSCVLPILIIRSFSFPLRLGNRQMPIIGQISMKSPLIGFVNLLSLCKVSCTSLACYHYLHGHL